MTTRERLEKIVEQMAMWAMEYRSAENRDSDVVAVVSGRDITVGHLRGAFERYYKIPFSSYQDETGKGAAKEAA